MINRLLTYLALAFLVWLFVWGLAHATHFSFRNDSTEKMIYMLYWWDHPFKDWGPANMAGGEVPSGETRHIGQEYHGNLWEVFIWNINNDVHGIFIEKPLSNVECVWDGEKITVNEKSDL